MKQNELDVICYLNKNPNAKQEEIAKALGLSLGSVNKYIKNKNLDISKYKVENAVLFAAGWGSRMSPITDNLPKPLVKVHGKPMVESVIESIQSSDIKNIYVVVGKLGDKFEYLVEKYGVTLIQNPDWSTRNNISSLYFAQKVVGNTLYFECDQMLKENILRTHFAKSCFHGTWRENWGREDYFVLNGKQVKDIKTGDGDKNFWNGVVFVSAEDQKLMIDLCNQVYDKPEYVDTLWEKLIITLIKEGKTSFDLVKLNDGDALELDTVEEIANYDDSYMHIWKEMKAKKETELIKIK